jgi:hypothetical protein
VVAEIELADIDFDATEEDRIQIRSRLARHAARAWYFLTRFLGKGRSASE